MLRLVVITHSSLTYRTIDVDRDADLVAANHYEACVATFGDNRRYEGRAAYLKWLRRQVDEFPDGHVLAYDAAGPLVGHLEVQVPYGKAEGYISLFYVPANRRCQGFGRRLQAYVERYGLSWEATRVSLHVSPSNRRAMEFYRHLGYAFTGGDRPGERLWRMTKDLTPAPAPHASQPQ